MGEWNIRKITYIWMTVLFFLVIFSALIAYANPVANPSFEDGLNNWSQTGQWNSSVQYYNTAYSTFADLPWSNISLEINAQQIVTATPASSWEYSFADISQFAGNITPIQVQFYTSTYILSQYVGVSNYSAPLNISFWTKNDGTYILLDYVVIEGSPIIPENSTLTLEDDSDLGLEYVNSNVGFYANYRDSGMNPIDTGNTQCIISFRRFDDTMSMGPYSMSYNAGSYEYFTSFDAVGLQYGPGNHFWNVTCTDPAYFTAIVTETVNISQSPGISYCSQFGTEPNCIVENPDCYWFSVSCEYNSSAYCSTTYLNNSGMICEDDPSCVWDATYSFCKDDSVGGGGGAIDCYNLTDEWQCKNEGECAWNAVSCENASAYCPSKITEPTCKEIDSCTWNYDNSTCFGSYAHCNSYPGSALCNNDMLCAWNADLFECEDKNTYCSDFFTEPTCMVEPKCMWDPMYFDCIGKFNPPSCDAFIASFACNDQIFCGWNSSSSLCINSSIFCPSLITEPTCNTENCAWNSTDCKDFKGFCTIYPDQTSCDPETLCYWDYGDSACKYDFYGGGCFGYMNYDSCVNDTLCMWNGYSCQDSGSYCSMYITEPTCSIIQDCIWDTANSSCKDNYGFCGGFTNMSSCNSDPGCIWDMTICRDIFGFCNQFTDPTGCNSKPVCHWDGLYCAPNDIFDSIVKNPSFETGDFTGWQNSGWGLSNHAMRGMVSAEVNNSFSYQLYINGDPKGFYYPIPGWFERKYFLSDYIGETINISFVSGLNILSQNNIFLDISIPEPQLVWVDDVFNNNSYVDDVMIFGGFGGAMCYNIFDETECYNSPGCVWNGMVCNNEMQYCETFITQPTCDTNPDCIWDGNGCYPIMMPMSGNSKVEGYVDVAGSPATYTSVCLHPGMGYPFCTSTGETGQYSFSGLPPGEFAFIIDGKWGSPRAGGIAIGDPSGRIIPFKLSVEDNENITLNATLPEFEVMITDLSRYYLAKGDSFTAYILIDNFGSEDIVDYTLELMLEKHWCEWNGTDDKCYDFNFTKDVRTVNVTAGTTYSDGIPLTIPNIPEVTSGQVQLTAVLYNLNSTVTTNTGLQQAAKFSMSEWYLYLNDPVTCSEHNSEYDCYMYPGCVWIPNIITGINCTQPGFGAGNLHVEGILKNAAGNPITSDNAFLCMGTSKYERRCTANAGISDAKYNPATGVFNFTNLPSGTYGFFANVFNITSGKSTYLEMFNEEDFLNVFNVMSANITLYDQTSLNVRVMDSNLVNKPARSFGFTYAGFEEQKIDNTTDVANLASAGEVRNVSYNIGDTYSVIPGELLAINISVFNNNGVAMENFSAFVIIEGGWTDGMPQVVKNSTNMSIVDGEANSTIVYLRVPQNFTFGDAQLIAGIKKRGNYVSVGGEFRKAEIGQDNFYFLDIKPEAPEIIMFSPEFGPTTDSTPLVNFTVLNSSELSYLSYSVDCYIYEEDCDINLTISGSHYEFDLPEVGLGHHDLFIYAFDQFGYMGEAYRHVYYTTNLIPEVFLYYPMNNSVIPQGDAIEFEINPKGMLTAVNISKDNGATFTERYPGPMQWVDLDDMGMAAGNSYDMVALIENEFGQQTRFYFTVNVFDETNDTAMQEAAGFKFNNAYWMLNDKINNLDNGSGYGSVEEGLFEAFGTRSQMLTIMQNLTTLQNMSSGANASQIQDYFYQVEALKNNTVGDVKLLGNTTTSPLVFTELEEDYFLDLLMNASYNLTFDRNLTDSFMENFTLKEQVASVSVTYLSGRSENYTKVTQIYVDQNNNTYEIVFLSGVPIYMGRNKPFMTPGGERILIIDKNFTGQNGLNLDNASNPIQLLNLTNYTVSIVDPDPVVKWSFSQNTPAQQAPAAPSGGNSGGGGGGSSTPKATTTPANENLKDDAAADKQEGENQGEYADSQGNVYDPESDSNNQQVGSGGKAGKSGGLVTGGAVADGAGGSGGSGGFNVLLAVGVIFILGISGVLGYMVLNKPKP